MRIVGGAYRGRALAGLGSGDARTHLRPTSDRVRESLFNLLAHGGHADPPPPEGARVLDLFAGTGALGLEALSRGAACATFVDSGRAALGLLRDNIARLGVADRTRVLARDALRLGPNAGPAFSLVFLDPPYRRGLGESALAAALQGGWIGDGALIVWEDGGEIAPPPGLERRDTRRYGDTRIGIFACRTA
jgi:16S rRNA (guanine966-N2)-methyltransferase